MKNKSLKNLANTRKDESLEDLIDYLKEECIDVKHLERIEQRSKDTHFAESQRQRNIDQKFNYETNYRNNGYRNNGFVNSGNQNNYQKNFNGNQGPQGNFSNDQQRYFIGNQGPQGNYRNDQQRNFNNDFGNNNGYRNDNRRDNYYREQNNYRNKNDVNYEFENDIDSNSSIETESTKSEPFIPFDYKRVMDESERFEVFYKPQVPLWNPHMDGLENINFSRDKRDDYLKEFQHEDFSRNFSKLDSDRVKFSKRILGKDEVESTFLIVNSRSAYKELINFIHLPNGLKEYLNGRIFSIPEEKLWRLIVNGTRKSEQDSEILREGLVDGFHNCPEFVKSAKTIQIVSYRKLLDISKKKDSTDWSGNRTLRIWSFIMSQSD